MPRIGLTSQILLGMLLGVLWGVFFGEASLILEPVGQAFVMLLQMPVLIYLFCSIVVGISRLSFKGTRGVFYFSLIYFVLSVGITKLSIYALPLGFPTIKVASQFAASSPETPTPTNFLDYFIPENPFRSFAEGTVPAIVVFSIFIAAALLRVRRNEALMRNFVNMQEASAVIIAWITRLSPIGVFALTAATAGVQTLSYFREVQYYYYAYFFSAIIISVVIIPLLVSAFVPLNYASIIGPLRPALLLAFTSGNVLVTLPLVISALEKETQDFGYQDQKGGGLISTLVPLLFNFPVAGKLVSLIFIYFIGWHYNNEISGAKAMELSALGLLTSFGTLSHNMKFLVESLKLPIDSMDIFLSSWVITSRFAAVSTVVSIATFCLFTTTAFEKRLTFYWGRLVVALLIAAFSYGAWFFLMHEFARPIVETNYEQMLLKIDNPADSATLNAAQAARLPLRRQPGSLLEIARSKKLRVGYLGNTMPFAYTNAHHELVGLDIELAHALAKDLGLQLTFVPINPGNIVPALNQGQIDIVMSGVFLSLELIRDLSPSNPYLTGNLALIMKDHLRKKYSSVAAVNSLKAKIAVVRSSPRVAVAKKLFGEENLVLINSPDDFLNTTKADVMLWSTPEAITWSLMHPFFTVVTDDEPLSHENLVFVLAHNGNDLLNYINKWIELQVSQGVVEQNYNKWVLGKKSMPQKRWSILDNVILSR
jgi:Na+/H+-dicarboxylate symporter/ABC-type amino acid transport substrate-binding protein